MKQKVYLLVTTVLLTANTYAVTSLADLNSVLQNALTTKNSNTSTQAPLINFYGGRDLTQTVSISLPSANFVPSYV